MRRAIEELLEPRGEVAVAKLRQCTQTFDGVEVGRRLELALLRERTGIGAVSIVAAAARESFERHGVVVYRRA